MAGNKQLGNAKAAKNDEFYTQLADIQAEVNAYLDYDPDVFRGKTILLPCDDPEWSNFTRFFAQNFERFGLKKLVSTSYAPEAKKAKYGIDLFDFAAGRKLDPARGRILVLDRDTNGNGRIDYEDLEWSYLDGDGDFRSDEVRRLRDEADVIITNPPFSLFREFLAWIVEADKKFLIIGNQNAIAYKEVFPLIMSNKAWLGESIHSGDREFGVPDEYPLEAASWRIDDQGRHYIRVKGVRWFTNLDHGRRHQPLKLMTEADNIKFSKHKEVRGIGYREYDNYDAIEVPFSDAIPADHAGVMGVPITFLDKYCPDQFEILGITDRGNAYGIKTREYTEDETPNANDLNRRGAIRIGGKLQSTYARILIRRKKGTSK
jgi:hypothetical protein